ncbi:MAG: G8 domain-containing protein [Rhodothermales bacterium]
MSMRMTGLVRQLLRLSGAIGLLVFLFAQAAHAAAPRFPDDYLRWSDPATWHHLGVAKPAAGDIVTIPAGVNLVLDENPPALAGIFVEGSLYFDDRDLALSADYIIVRGLFQIGTEEAPYLHRGVITLTGDHTDESTNIASCGTKVLCAQGGQLDFHGSVGSPTWTRLADGATAQAGATSITLQEAVSWQPGDEIVIVSTDFDPNQAERRILSGVSADGTVLYFDTPLAYMHWGEIMEYAGRPVDQRAEVMHLSRNILIQGDAASEADGFGGHVMIVSKHHEEMMTHAGHDRDDMWLKMWEDPQYANDPTTMSRIDGVEFYRMGQTGHMARYPVHFHLMGHADGAYLKNNAVHDSFQRCYTIHGTFNVLLEGNVGYNSIGHCYFLENFVERDNTLIRNIGAVMRAFPDKSQELIESDVNPSIFWISYPTNTLIGNVAAGAEGFGFWIDLRDTGGSAHNENASAPMGEVRDNVVHSTVLGSRRGLYGTGDPQIHGGAGFMYEGGVGPIENLNAYKNMVNFWADESSDFELVNATFSDAHFSIWQRRDGSMNSLFVAHTANVGTPKTEDEKLVGRTIPPYMNDKQRLISAIMGFYSKSFSINNTFIGYKSDDLFERGVASVGSMSFDAPIFFEGSTMIDSDPFVPTPAKVERRRRSGSSRARETSRGVVIIDSDGTLTGENGYREVRVGPGIMTDETAGCRQTDTKFDTPVMTCTTRAVRFASFEGNEVTVNGTSYSGDQAEALFLPEGRIYEVKGPVQGKYATREGFRGEYVVLKFTDVPSAPRVRPNSKRDSIEEAPDVASVVTTDRSDTHHRWYYDAGKREFWLRIVTGDKANAYGEANMEDGVRQPFSRHYGVKID